MTGLKPFFTYFGGKYRLAPRYPKPEHPLIIEPFAGAAGYSLRYPERQVVLIERSEAIAGIWRYLTRVRPAEVLRLPLMEAGQSVDSLNIPQEARWLIGMWVNPGSAQPKKTLTVWGRHDGACARHVHWGAPVRERIASQVRSIRHWVIQHGSYECAPNVAATWFIDPPYRGAGRHYPWGSRHIDYPRLADWCRARLGQRIVCENEGADWLPFRPFAAAKGTRGVSLEAVWP